MPIYVTEDCGGVWDNTYRLQVLLRGGFVRDNIRVWEGERLDRVPEGTTILAYAAQLPNPNYDDLDERSIEFFNCGPFERPDETLVENDCRPIRWIALTAHPHELREIFPEHISQRGRPVSAAAPKSPPPAPSAAVETAASPPIVEEKPTETDEVQPRQEPSEPQFSCAGAIIGAILLLMIAYAAVSLLAEPEPTPTEAGRTAN